MQRYAFAPVDVIFHSHNSLLDRMKEIYKQAADCEYAYSESVMTSKCNELQKGISDLSLKVRDVASNTCECLFWFRFQVEEKKQIQDKKADVLRQMDALKHQRARILERSEGPVAVLHCHRALWLVDLNSNAQNCSTDKGSCSRKLKNWNWNQWMNKSCWIETLKRNDTLTRFSVFQTLIICVFPID